MARLTAEHIPAPGIARWHKGDHTYVCNCGYTVPPHRRLKVIEDRLDNHFKKKHGNRGMRI